MSRAGAIRWDLRSRAARYPWYLPLARRRYGESVLGDRTELVIDGFTRGAVTFSVLAFQIAQRRPVRVAHTLHAPAHVIAAARAGVPCLVTIRDPDATVLSTVIREPDVSIAMAFRAYTRFYETIRPFRSGLVLAGFDEVTSDLGAVIERVNRRFGTRFDRFRHTRENVELVYQVIEDRSRRPPWSSALGDLEDGVIGIDEYRSAKARSLSAGRAPEIDVPEWKVQRPSPQRSERKERLRARLEDPAFAMLRKRARSLYERSMEEPDTG